MKKGRKLFKRVLDELAQQTKKTVYGEKTVEASMPGLCRKAAAEGAVLLKNQGNILPLREGAAVAVFGRVQLDWFYVGYGSGGDVNPPYTVNLAEGLKNAGIPLDQPLLDTYVQWSAANPPNMGFWGHWPRYFKEMPLEDSLVQGAASRCQTALVVIGRAAGESRENALEPGSYYLTPEEKAMLSQVTKAFAHTVVLINAGGILDLSWLEEYPLDGALFLWQGGMESGNAAADVLTGKVDACGRLTDTVAYRYEDYPSAKDFLGMEFNCYTEDVYVGYRYFETFAPDAVQFPFGFGLSYTSFAMEAQSVALCGDNVIVAALVKNTGSRPGKEVVQAYVEPPQGKLGKPLRNLAAFQKTRLLQPGESQRLVLSFPATAAASFDDGGRHRPQGRLGAGTRRIPGVCRQQRAGRLPGRQLFRAGAAGDPPAGRGLPPFPGASVPAHGQPPREGGFSGRAHRHPLLKAEGVGTLTGRGPLYRGQRHLLPGRSPGAVLFG